MKLKSNGKYIYLADDNGDAIGNQIKCVVRSEVGGMTTATVTFKDVVVIDGEIDFEFHDETYSLKRE